MTLVRFAPTPSGYLFLSGARVALANILFARRHGGRMLLRFDDLDRERTSPAFAESMRQDLHWLGIQWDEELRQSERLPLYQDAIEQLQQTGRLYPCFESDEELRAKRDQRQKRGQPTVYDRAMLRLTPSQRAAAEARGKRPYWRFLLSDRELRWRDLVFGNRHIKLQSVSDPVLVRADGRPAPLLAAVVDDIEIGITHVIRGEDNACNTGIQLDLLAALGADPARIVFAHLPSLAEAGRNRFGRRVGSLSLRSLRQDGIQPNALATILAEPLSSPGARPASLDTLAARFDLSHLSADAARFDAERLLELNRAVLASLDFTAVADRLPPGATEAFWRAVRGDLDLLTEARGWWDVVAGTIVPPVIEGEHDYLRLAEQALPAEPWDSDIWHLWTGTLEAATGRDQTRLAAPLRLALTGEDYGPDLAPLLPLIGRNRVVNRLRVAAA